MTLHKRILIWRPDGFVENIEPGQNFFLIKVNHIDKKIFDRQLEKKSPCMPSGTGISFRGYVLSCGSIRPPEELDGQRQIKR